MSAGTHLRESLGAFLLRVRRIAEAVDRHADVLSRASRGRVGRKTADEMRRLADQIADLQATRAPKARSSLQATIAEARQLMVSIRRAAQYAARSNPDIAARLSGAQKDAALGRSRAAVQWALGSHIALIDGHPRELGPLLPANTRAVAAGLHERLLEYLHQWVRGPSEDEGSLAERIERLVMLEKEVRALAMAAVRNSRGEFR